MDIKSKDTLIRQVKESFVSVSDESSKTMYIDINKGELIQIVQIDLKSNFRYNYNANSRIYGSEPRYEPLEYECTFIRLLDNKKYYCMFVDEMPVQMPTKAALLLFADNTKLFPQE